ncbi:hypothetical protein LSH36_282g03048 [Paralvinella palmiformis]|uniref:Methyltransferase FkbM domain-containing protein n=1 Tax=Paralvinella palmiformis TaxID=53620 RepID=A0AAD9JKH3_9ANNE|nr:hypothetical protein LSH36_282g03048 [Paralvinella palmiformis]
MVFVCTVIMVILSLMWEISQPVDGTFIDLSEKHQMELIEKYVQERQLLSELKQRQLAINQQDGVQNLYGEEAFFQGHANILPDARIGESNFNVSKHLQENPHVIIQRKKHIDVTDKQINNETGTEIQKPKAKTKLKRVKYYDPNQGKIVYKPVIVEDKEIEGGAGHCRVYDLSGNLTENYDCIQLKVEPSTPICLYPDEMDVHISRHLREEGIWEPHIVDHFQKVLSLDSEMVVIDIGANIGQYTLIAASMGHRVIAVEPYANNIKHLQKAAQIGGLLDKITVLQNAISDSRKKYFLKLWPDNQGGVSLVMENPNPDSEKPPSVSTMYMDDLLEVITFNKALIKIDIEGHEHRAFLYSSKFFRKVSVPYIFMEWMKLRKYYGSEITNTEDKLLTQKLVTFLLELGYHAYSSVTMEKLDPKWWESWTDDIIWKHDFLAYS